MKFIFTTACCLSILFIKAQEPFSKDTKFLSGGISFNYNENKAASTGGSFTNSSFTFNPSFSKFVSPTKFHSIGISYFHSMIRQEGSASTQTDISDGIGLFFSTTHLKKISKGFFFTYGTEFSGGYNAIQSDFKSTSTSQTQKARGFTASASVNIGVMVKLSERFLLSTDLNNLAAVNYSHSSTKLYLTSGTQDIGNANSINFSTGLQSFNLGNLTVGIHYVLRKK